MSRVESSGANLLSTRRPGRLGGLCVLGLLVGVGCSDPLRLGRTGGGGTGGSLGGAGGMDCTRATTGGAPGSASIAYNGVFTPTGNMTVGRASPTVTVLANGKVLVVGGWSGQDYLASAELYDPSTEPSRAQAA